MPYDKAEKLAAKIHVNAIRQQTKCEHCGNQPIEWHHESHLVFTNRRIAHLVALGFPIPVIDAEIAKCEALCRRCHMVEDGRINELRANCPNQKGAILVPEAPCQRCGVLSKPTRKGKCRKCYDGIRRGTLTQ